MSNEVKNMTVGGKIAFTILMGTIVLTWGYMIHQASTEQHADMSSYRPAAMPIEATTLRECLDSVEQSYQFDLTVHPKAITQIKTDHTSAQDFCYKKFR